MKGRVGLVGWPVADGLPTLVVTHQLQVERRTGKVRQSETDVLPLCHSTNCAVYHAHIQHNWRAASPHRLTAPSATADILSYEKSQLVEEVYYRRAWCLSMYAWSTMHGRRRRQCILYRLLVGSAGRRRSRAGRGLSRPVIRPGRARPRHRWTRSTDRSVERSRAGLMSPRLARPIPSYRPQPPPPPPLLLLLLLLLIELMQPLWPTRSDPCSAGPYTASKNTSELSPIFAPSSPLLLVISLVSVFNYTLQAVSHIFGWWHFDRQVQELVATIFGIWRESTQSKTKMHHSFPLTSCQSTETKMRSFHLYFAIRAYVQAYGFRRHQPCLCMQSLMLDSSFYVTRISYSYYRA